MDVSKDSLDKLEHKLFASYHDDGIIDLLAGIVMVCMGIAWAYDLVALGPIAPVVVIPLWKPLRERLTIPRVGFAELSDKRTRQITSMTRMSALLGVATLVLAVVLYFSRGPEPGTFIQIMIPGLPAMLLSLLFVIGAFMTGALRSLVYAGVLMIAGGFTIVWSLRPEAAMLVGGGVILSSAILLLTRFLMSHPVVEDDFAPHSGSDEVSA